MMSMEEVVKIVCIVSRSGECFRQRILPMCLFWDGLHITRRKHVGRFLRR